MLMFFNGLIFILIILFIVMRAEATPLTDFESEGEQMKVIKGQRAFY